MVDPTRLEQPEGRAALVADALALAVAVPILVATSLVARTRAAWRGARDRTRAATRGCPCSARYRCRFPACGQGEGLP